jgi:hypothetical protein
MAETTALNLRKFDPDLRQALKVEADANNLSLQDYCSEILSGKRSRMAEGIVPRGTLAELKQEEPPAVGNWDAVRPQAGAALQPVSGPGVVAPKAKVACPHGWLNRVLCPECRAAL